MRISGGAARGIPLLAPKGDAVRPATDSMRQAVFSSLAARVPGARFLDLFAGSGAYGLEALSRGAQGGVFVEQNAQAATCLRTNLTAVCKSLRRGEEDLQVLIADAGTLPLGAGSAPDLIFIDPPYDLIPVMAEPLFARLTAALAGQPDPLIVFEMPGGVDLQAAGWSAVKRLGKGFRQPSAVIYRRMSPS
jgi:16S rRNA (guanine966-N2)-methyltransferase